MNFLRLPLEPLEPASRRVLLSEGRDTPLFAAILQEMQDHAAASLDTAAGQAAVGEPNAYQLGAAFGVSELGTILHAMAHAVEEADPSGAGEGGEG